MWVPSQSVGAMVVLRVFMDPWGSPGTREVPMGLSQAMGDLRVFKEPWG